MFVFLLTTKTITRKPLFTDVIKGTGPSGLASIPKCRPPYYRPLLELARTEIEDYAKEIIKIAEKSLKNAQTGEDLFLEAIKEYTMKGISPADVIQKKWNGIWNKDLRKMIKYIQSVS